MKTLITNSGKIFDILWDGVSTIDGALRFAIVNASMPEIFSAFSNPEETGTLTRVWDGIESVYTGYNQFRGFDRKADGEIVVTMEAEV